LACLRPHAGREDDPLLYGSEYLSDKDLLKKTKFHQIFKNLKIFELINYLLTRKYRLIIGQYSKRVRMIFFQN
jgi:hypothetical protein